MSGTRDPAPGGLVGRRRELTAIAAAVRRLDRRNAQFVAVSGEPGIGKTSLLEELARRAEASGARVLAGRGTELEGDLPFGVWVDAFDAHVAWLGHERLERLIGAAAAAQLAGVLPAAAPAAGTPPLADERFQAHRAVRVLLERIAAAGPLVVLLDDVHWADGASLELLVHLLRRPPRATLLLGLGFRSGRLPPEVAAALQATDRAGTLVDLPLAPLTEDDAGALLGAGAPAGLYGLAGGNPFYLMELARAGAATAADAAETGVPAAVAAAMTHEIAELSEPARLLAEGAAVAGDGAELELAAAAAGIGRETALAALDEIVAASLLRATGEGRRYRFRHPIVRRAVYEAAGEGWRLAAHARAAAELERRGAGLGARAQHVERCAELGDETAIALLAAAGLEAAPRAPGAAARWLGAALRLMPQREEDASRRLQLLVPLAGALASTGQLERALATLLAALELIPAELVELRVRLVCACAGCENLLGRHMAAHERLLRVLGEVAEDSGEAACALCAELAADALFDADFGQMNLWAERASAAADALGDPALRVTAAALLCFARYAQGAIADAEAARATAASLLDGLPDAALAGRLEAAYYLGFAEFFCEHYDEAIGHLRRGIAVSRAAGLGQFVVPMMVGLAHALEVRGRLPEALDTAEGAVEAARLARNRQMASWALVAEGWIAAMTGDSARADAAAEEAVALVSGLDLSVVTLATHAHAAVIFLEAGRPERCLQQAVSAGAPEFPSIEPSRRAWLQAALARAELARGHPEGAARWIERAERSLRDGPLPLAEAAVLTARAQSASAGGDHAAAARFASRAAERADAVGADVDAARARVLAGQALARAGDRDGAGRLLARAEADLTACGAHRLRDEAARELRRLGRHVAARQRRFAPGKGAGALSGREREIADLVAAGNTNRQIAAQLFLSEKTIESHLSNVFAKLGVGSRAAVAAAVARQGDDADG